MNPYQKRNILWQDAMVVVGFCLYLGAGFITKLILAQVAGTEGYVSNIEMLESNPIARETLKYRYGMLVMQITAISFMGGIYYILRRRMIKESVKYEVHYVVLSFYTISLMLVFLQNFMNDLPILIGITMG